MRQKRYRKKQLVTRKSNRLKSKINTANESIDDIKSHLNEQEQQQIQEKLYQCYNCLKSSPFEQIIDCAYCKLYFHYDCLNPPLCGRPAHKWMCPFHVEHYLNERSCESPEFNAKLKTWNRKQFRPNSRLIKEEFIQNIQAKKKMKATEDEQELWLSVLNDLLSTPLNRQEILNCKEANQENEMPIL